MTFTRFTKMELFEHIKSLWPTEINLDGMVFNGRRVTGLQILNELIDDIRESIPVNDHWRRIAAWSFHQAFCPDSNEKIHIKQSFAYPALVTFEEFNQKMLSNLEDESWKLERIVYSKTAVNEKLALT